MGVTDIPAGQCVYLDTNVFIYALEGYPRFLKLLSTLFARLDEGDLHAVTSELTVAEVLVKPMLEGNTELQERYQQALSSSAALSVVPVSRALLVAAAGLRAQPLSLRLPDALHVATAQAYGCQYFITNDLRLNVPHGVRLLLLSENVED